MLKPVAESCLRNQAPILDVLRKYISNRSLRILELASGTGQHCVYMARHLPDTLWQPSDVPASLPGIEAWRDAEQLDNVLPAQAIDVDAYLESSLCGQSYDAVFMANALHFVSFSTAENFVHVAAQSLQKDGLMFVYGPFNRAGLYTSEGNRRLDSWLRQRDPASGLKDQEWLFDLAAQCGFALQGELRLPANNLLFVFHKP